MTTARRSGPWRVLIASSHPLFAKGLRSLLQKRPRGDVAVVGLVSTVAEALDTLREHRPDLVIVDYDDEVFNRDEILARLVEGEGRLRVVLLSLGEKGDEAIVYDRRSMAASNIAGRLVSWAPLSQRTDQRASTLRPGTFVAVRASRDRPA